MVSSKWQKMKPGSIGLVEKSQCAAHVAMRLDEPCTAVDELRKLLPASCARHGSIAARRLQQSNPKWLNLSSDTQEAILAEPPLRR